MTLVHLSLWASVTLAGSSGTTRCGQSPPIRGLTLTELVVVLAIVTTLAAITLPGMVGARTKTQRQLCIENLGRIEIAKSTWAIEQDRNAEEAPFEEDLGVYFSNGQFPVCPAGGEYDIGTLQDLARCSLDSQGHRYDGDTAGNLAGGEGGKGSDHGKGHGNGHGHSNGHGKGTGNGNQ